MSGDTMFATLSSCVLVLPGSGVAQIPKEPDFSGEWVLLTASGTTSDPAPALTVRQTITRTTMRGEPMTPWFSDLTVERHFRTGVVPENYKIGMIGGSVSGTATAASSPRREERTTVAVKWEGQNLIISTGKYSGPPLESGPYTEHEEMWSIDPSGRLLITITDRSSGSQTATVMLIYRRQPNPVALEHAPRGICERDATKLVMLPVSAWTYGTVVAVQETSLRAVGGADDAAIKANLEDTLAVLKALKVHADLWP